MEKVTDTGQQTPSSHGQHAPPPGIFMPSSNTVGPTFVQSESQLLNSTPSMALPQHQTPVDASTSKTTNSSQLKMSSQAPDKECKLLITNQLTTC